MLANPLFRHSKRYPVLLRYVVEHTLKGESAELKERTLGVAVFGRVADYDTNADPVVRATAGEIRKRIAQYYHEEGHQHEIRIDLSPGSYVPEFSLPAPVAEAPSAPPPRRSLPIIAALALILGAALLWWKPWVPRNALDRFWRPVLDSRETVLLCVGQRQFLATSAEPGQPSAADLPHPGSLALDDSPSPSLFTLYYLGSQNVAFHDVFTVARVAGLLQSRSRAYQLRGQRSTSFADLRSSPVVLIGALDNDWTMRLMGQLRFSFERDGTVFWIKDSQHPRDRSRAVNYSLPYRQLTEDYALITRLLHPTTERMVVLAAGLTGYGTMAAGEFLTTPAYLEQFAKGLPADWQQRNVQVLLSTRVIDGVSGPPRVLARHFW